jgi:hypothetical protein
VFESDIFLELLHGGIVARHHVALLLFPAQIDLGAVAGIRKKRRA